MEREERAARILEECCQGAAGAVEAAPVLARMTEQSRRQALEQNPGLEAFVCCVFPYFNGLAPGNLSLYARGLDYHLAARDRLGRACRLLERQFPGFSFRGYADVSPFPEVYACARAGLGAIGQNGLLLTRRWGSYVFCGLIATDLPLKGGGSRSFARIAAFAASVARAALGERGELDQSRCLSALTQQKGELTERQVRLIRRGGMAWGCDICQRVCPYNRSPERTTLPEFRQSALDSLRLEDLEGLSQRRFRQLYGDRAFAWRGVAPLRRNLALLEEEGASPSEDIILP